MYIHSSRVPLGPGEKHLSNDDTLRWPLTPGPGQTPARTVRRISTRLLAPTRDARAVTVLASEKRHRAARRSENANTAGKVRVNPDSTPDAGRGDDQTGVARREEGRYGMTTPLGRRQAVGGGQAAQNRRSARGYVLR